MISETASTIVVINGAAIIAGSILRRLATMGKTQPTVFARRIVQHRDSVTVTHNKRFCPFIM